MNIIKLSDKGGNNPVVRETGIVVRSLKTSNSGSA
jgi:hypothetical protein